MKRILLLTIIIIFTSMGIFSQSFSSLWKQVDKAKADDLPQKEQQVLQKIIDKAAREAEYGQLMKAQLMQIQAASDVSPDSLKPAVDRLVAEAEQTGDNALRAVRYAALGRIYETNGSLDDNAGELAKEYFTKALEQPAVLASVKAPDYKPFVVVGSDSYVYDDDLLSVFGVAAGRYDLLSEYYNNTQNRHAQLYAALGLLRQGKVGGGIEEPLQKSDYMHSLDSLIERFGDLPECGEVAIERLGYMAEHTDATTAQIWQYANVALDKWGRWKRMNEVRDRQRLLSVPQFNVTLPNEVALPGKEQEVKLTELRGIRELTLNIYKVKANGDIELNPADDDDYPKLKPLLTLLPSLTQTRTYIGKQPYELYEDTITLPALEKGVYMVEAISNPSTDISRHLLFVSDVRAIVMALPDKLTRIVAVSATTGRPLPKAKIHFIDWEYKYNRITGQRRTKKVVSQKADKNGECITSSLGYSASIYITTDDDSFCPPRSGMNGYYGTNANYRFPLFTDIFTDRAIYRPGQTVYAAAILYKNRDGYINEVRANTKVRMVLRDTNNKEAAIEELTTDEFGTCSTQFQLPTQGLTGRFCIQVNDERHYFRVEDYKRPTFELEFPKVTENYEDGDTVVVRPTARTYSGVPVQGAKVTWQVVRRRAFWWHWYSPYWQQGMIGTGSDDEQMASGEAVTEADGTFAAEMPMTIPHTRYPMFYTFELRIQVTDQAGETHEGQMSLPLGNRKTALSCNLPDKMLREKMKPMTLHLLNAAGNDIPGTVLYQIDGGPWEEVATNTPIALPQLNSGSHTIRAKEIVGANASERLNSETDFSIDADYATLEHTFVVFSPDDQRPPVETDDWFWQSASQFPNDGSPVTLQVGASGENVHIVYAIFSGDRQLESGFADKTDELINRRFNYSDDYNNGLLLTFAWMRDGELHQHSTTILRPVPDNKLTLQWNTFRDRLTPGQKEEWTLTIKRPDGTPAPAQLMATLYDKSLEALVSHSLSLSPYLSLPIPHTYWRATKWNAFTLHAYDSGNRLYAPSLMFNTFDSSVFPSPYHQRYNYITRSRKMSGKALARAKGPVLYELAVEEEVAEMDGMVALQSSVADVVPSPPMNDEAAEAEGQTDDNCGAGGTSAPAVRENLQETAFFMPQLVAGPDGEVKMKFTLPESLTTWRFLGLAHTTDMMVGTIDGEAVARKDVMIQPNVPRFLRQGDKATIAARIINTGEKPIKGQATLELLHPETLQPVAKETKKINVDGGTTASVSFNCQPTDEWPSLLVIRAIVEGKGFSDGEQHYLPILPDKERVTVSVPFTQNEPGTKTIDLAALIPATAITAPGGSLAGVNASKLTFEYTNNPAWLLIQALPTVGHPHDDCAVCQCVSLYANAIGRHIIKQNPNAKNVFEAWLREEGNETSLTSSLEKNQELRELLLNETPWVADADREGDQKRAIGNFFDENLIRQRIASATQKLKALQQGDGGWSWWPGMRSSLYMTTSITEILVRLNQMTGQQSETRQMLENAFDYLGRETVEIVKEMKRLEKQGYEQTFPSHRCLEWLYLCAIDGRQLPSKVQSANDYLIDLMKKDKLNQSIREKALSAIVLGVNAIGANASGNVGANASERLNNSKLAKTYIQSLKEWTVYREDMGRYYDTDRALYSWRDYRLPTQVAAIEALQLLTPDDKQTIQEMQRWLLQQKRTQAWDTPINSADAIYAFLNDNKEALAPQPATDLRVDGQPLPASKATAGVGYVKAVLPLQKQKTFTATKTSTGTSWGAVYAQFMQLTSDIKEQTQSGIKVKRELFIVEDNNRVKPCETVAVGQKLRVRITIEADRDYDFVQVVDKRAACLEPVRQLSGWNWQYGCYCAPRDNATCFYFDLLSKGKHVVEADYYADRAGTYETGTCTAECAYSPEFRGKARSTTITVVE